VKQSLERVLTEPCPYCSGSSVIKSSATICYEILSEVKKLGPDLNGQSLVLRVNPDIARALREEERAVFKDLRQAMGKEIAIRPDAQLHHEQFDLMAIG
jgi:ribonuclease G